MITQILKPQKNSFVVNIPDSYINKEVEFIMFPLDKEYKIQKKSRQDILNLAGSLSKYAKIAKIDLEKKAWESYIMDKYK
jgi:hypothetical protein